MKEVRFDTSKNQIHHLFVWDFAYRSHRKPYWEYFALDRWRFCQRCQKVNNILRPILNDVHRKKVFKERFVNL